MSLIFATQLAAIATAALAVGAIVTAIFAILAYLKQKQEISHLLKESEREGLERRRAQAARVFTCVPHDPVRLVSPYAKNTSDSPVYGAQLWYTGPRGLTGPDELGMIAPGATAPTTISPRFSVADALENTILTFRDASGVHWIRMPDGMLTEQTRGTSRESILAITGGTPESPQDHGDRQQGGQ